MTTIRTAPDLFALAMGVPNRGDHACYWCGSAAEKDSRHKYPAPMIGQPPLQHVKFPRSPFICRGCARFRKPSVTIFDLAGGFKDGQQYENHSLWMTRMGCAMVAPTQRRMVYDLLLNPPLTFALSLLTGATKEKTRLQGLFVNDHAEIKADTPLYFSIDNMRVGYTVYDLQNALKLGAEGLEPGIRMLVDHCGPLHDTSFEPTDEPPPEEKRGRGRPPAKPEDDPRRVVRGGQQDPRKKKPGR